MEPTTRAWSPNPFLSVHTNWICYCEEQQRLGRSASAREFARLWWTELHDRPVEASPAAAPSHWQLHGDLAS